MQFDAKNKRDNALLEKVTLSHFNKVRPGITVVLVIVAVGGNPMISTIPFQNPFLIIPANPFMIRAVKPQIVYSSY